MLLYLCQERADVQFAVKNLASYLKTPTEAATTFAKQTVKYLLGTRDYGILSPYGDLFSTAMDQMPNFSAGRLRSQTSFYFRSLSR